LLGLKTASPSIVWFRNDLRLADNSALEAALRHGGPVIPVFIWAPEEEGDWPPGAASRWWLHQSLARLRESLEQRGVELVFQRGPSNATLLNLVRQTKADAVFWNTRYEPALVRRDRMVEQELRFAAVKVEVFEAGLLTDPWSVRNKSGKPFQVFTPFWNSCLATLDPQQPSSAPRSLTRFTGRIDSAPLEQFKLEPRINWAAGIAATWQPGEIGATKALERFCATDLSRYTLNRDRPDIIGTSRLSPHLHFGEISARQVLHALRRDNRSRTAGEGSWKNSRFVAELGWREFAYHLICHYPHTPTRPLRPEFERFPWSQRPELLKAWQRGQTGYPMVDAGMRELWTTGWMHNRLRMVVGSFLVKHLLIPWQEGARWFWGALVDADLANNTLGWQWTAGCGADAAPFFRIFNPVSQGQKFDPDGEYVRRWVPELAGLTAEWIHQPWEAPVALLQQAGVKLGRTYPARIVEHASARAKALAAYEKIKGRKSIVALG
jgi:deoxyribodipyrimidine photo-lyase